MRFNHRSQYRHDGWPMMRGHMLNTLHQLRDAHQRGQLWVTSVQIHWIPELYMMRRAMIFASRDPLGGPTAYRILPEGLRVLEHYETTVRRMDKTCPRCEERLRAKRRNGRFADYCCVCEAAVRRERSQRRFENHTDEPCVSCGLRPRKISAGGWQYTLCSECRRAYTANHYRRQQARLRARIEAGEVIVCPLCGERPVSVTKTKVNDRCRPCHNRIRRRQRMQESQRNRSGSQAAD
jgi:hypothetical protein